MDERSLQEITRYLQREDAQEKIRQNIAHGRSQITVPIGGAVELFHFSENQLRKWEDKGLLKPQREGRQRHYTLQDLDKLAIIRVLIDAKYSPSDIPPNIDSIWFSMAPSDGQQRQIEQVRPPAVGSESEHLHIDKRIERIDEEAFWRYFISQALRLSIMLICENIPDTLAGLVLPLQKQNTFGIVRSPTDLSKLGDCLIGWLDRNRSFYAFLDSEPSFGFPSDFRVQPLMVIEETIPKEAIPPDNTLIIVQRESKRLNLSASFVKTVRRLLEPIYNKVNDWRPCFDYGIRDWVYQVTDFTSSSNPFDHTLNRLSDMVVHLGGKTPNGWDRWHFCCILLPEIPALPLQQQSLVVRAQSEHAPYTISEATVSTKSPGLSLSAYQSGHVIYRPDTSVKDFMFANPEYEESTRSAIAIPVAGEDGMAIAVLYIASDETNAFSKDDQRVLRLMGKMVEELLMIYHAHQQPMGKLSDLIVNPGIADMSFKEFLSQNDFLNDIEVLLTAIKERIAKWKEPVRKEEVPLAEPEARYRSEQSFGEVVSFIAIDIDNQSSLATKYGDQVARNLSKAVGLRIQGQQRLYSNPEHRQLYHIYADRFYFLLKGMVLDEARNKAEQLRMALEGDYLIEARRTSAERLMLPERMLELSKVTVRVGVPSYTYGKLKELLQRYPYETAVADVRALIVHSLDEVLDLGRVEGGNVVIAWDPKTWAYIRWPPPS